MANTKKPTKKELFTEMLAQYELEDKHRELIEKTIEQLENRKSSEKKPTARQGENAVLRVTILDWMTERAGEKFTITDLWKKVPELANDPNMSNQRISALVRALYDEHKVAREEIKRKAYYSVPNTDDVRE